MKNLNKVCAGHYTLTIEAHHGTVFASIIEREDQDGWEIREEPSGEWFNTFGTLRECRDWIDQYEESVRFAKSLA